MPSAAPGASEEQQVYPQNQMDVQRPEGDPYRARSETHVSTAAEQQDNDEQSLKRKREESITGEAKRVKTGTYLITRLSLTAEIF